METNSLRKCASTPTAMPIGVVVFEIAMQEFCFDVRFLAGSLKPCEPGFQLPKEAGHPGRVVFNGRDYLLTDIGSFLQTETAAGSNTGWILLVEYGKKKLSFQVEAVTQIIAGIGWKDSPFSSKWKPTA